MSNDFLPQEPSLEATTSSNKNLHALIDNTAQNIKFFFLFFKPMVYQLIFDFLGKIYILEEKVTIQ